MTYPPYLARITHFAFDENAGLDAPSPTGVDAELNSVLEVLNQQNQFIRRITTADGRLKNLAAATAQALAGDDQITATASQTAFVTGIDWDSSFTVRNVWVFSGSTRVTPVSVQESAGFLEVTLAAQTVGTVLDFYAFSSGAGILTRLQTASASDGAHLVAIEDDGAYTSVVTVEDALQELYSHTQGATGKTWLEGVLVKSDYVLKAGSTMDSGADLTFSGGGTVKGLPAAAANGQAVRYEQFIALQTSITGITAIFMPKSGGTFTGAVSMNNQPLTGVPTPAGTDHAANKAYVDTTLASFGGLPVGTLIDFAGSSTPTGWLACDGAAVSRTTYASLFAVIGVVWGVGDGSTTFNVPDFRGRGTIGSGTGSGLTARTLAQTGGEESHLLTIPEMPAHTHGMPLETGGSVNDYAVITTAGSDELPDGTQTGTTGGGGTHNNMQPYAVVTKIIKH